MMRLDDAQERALRGYTLLNLLRRDWAGQLIVCCGLGPAGASFAVAGHVVGAVSLNIEPNHGLARAALRSGSCDFVVNTLDEALRAMKNEIRKKTPLAVGLMGGAVEVLGELVARGVAPAVFCDLAESAEMLGPAGGEGLKLVESLSGTGCAVLDFDGRLRDSGPAVVDGPARLGEFVGARGWSLHSFALTNQAMAQAFDAFVQDEVTADDVRFAWRRQGARMFGRERPPRRALWVTAAEHRAILKRFPEAG